MEDPTRGAYMIRRRARVESLSRPGLGAPARALRIVPAPVRVDGDALRAAVQGRRQQHKERTATEDALRRVAPAA